MKPAIRRLLFEYKRRRPEIRKRLHEFSGVHKTGSERIFREMCFCLLTANANALKCDEAIKDLESSGLISSGSARQIRPKLRGRVRFHNKKAEYIVGARESFRNICNSSDAATLRGWLVDNVKGLGYKEASHFLRNIGLGGDIAILDRHILKNLKKYGVINAIPSSMGSRKTYLDIEERMRAFSRGVKIPMDEMDLLFWSIQTGFVFK